MKKVAYLGEFEGEDGTVFIGQDGTNICVFTSGCVIDWVYENPGHCDSPLVAIKITKPNLFSVDKKKFLSMLMS